MNLLTYPWNRCRLLSISSRHSCKRKESILLTFRAMSPKPLRHWPPIGKVLRANITYDTIIRFAGRLAQSWHLSLLIHYRPGFRSPRRLSKHRSCRCKDRRSSHLFGQLEALIAGAIDKGVSDTIEKGRQFLDFVELKPSSLGGEVLHEGLQA